MCFKKASLLKQRFSEDCFQLPHLACVGHFKPSKNMAGVLTHQPSSCSSPLSEESSSIFSKRRPASGTTVGVLVFLGWTALTPAWQGFFKTLIVFIDVKTNINMHLRHGRGKSIHTNRKPSFTYSLNKVPTCSCMRYGLPTEFLGIKPPRIKLNT